MLSSMHYTAEGAPVAATKSVSTEANGRLILGIKSPLMLKSHGMHFIKTV